MVGPVSRVNSAGVKGGEGQETRLFSLTWVRGPSEKLLPKHSFRRMSRWKGERPRAFPLSFLVGWMVIEPQRGQRVIEIEGCE